MPDGRRAAARRPGHVHHRPGRAQPDPGQAAHRGQPRVLEHHSAVDGVQQPLSGPSTPAGFTETGFHWPPGTSGQGENFFAQTGISKWIWNQFWKSEGDFYKDPTPTADDATVKAVKDLDIPLYGKDADPSLPTPQRQQAYAEHQAWENLVNGNIEPTAADNARLFLSTGGFPRTAPQPGSVEYRIAVEDLKTRFAGCAWRTPVDPNMVLGKEVATASAEWQQEIGSQTGQRNQTWPGRRRRSSVGTRPTVCGSTRRRHRRSSTSR
ncbi:hypothetical protein [Streptomyces mirabilis]|uniref:hypothetical protein n=1 Tax=Streptomyces mirabilis TaxID=68239 RepID=UPI00382DF87E